MAQSELVPAQAPALGTGIDADTLIRSILFIAVFLSAWISFHPFPDLSQPPQSLAGAGDRVKEIGLLLLFLLLAGWAFIHDGGRLKLLLRPAMIVTFAWCAISALASPHPMLAASRLVFTLGNTGMAAMFLLLPKNTRHFNDLLAASVLIVLIVCYLGVWLAPTLAVHQPTDFAEPEHAGDWRGVFDHKNEAGAVMAQFIFIGMFVARARSLVLGTVIVTLSAIFLYGTQSKTAIGILPVALVLAAVFPRVRPLTAITLVVSVLVLFNLFSVGSIYFAPVHRLIDAIMPDPSFTGRTDIWRFAVDHVAQRPITGYGISAFWGTEHVVYGLSGSNWANVADNAHNGYLDIALDLGVPGLVLVLTWIVVLAPKDYCNAPSLPHTEPLKRLFLRVCLYGIYTSCFETVLFPYVGGTRFLLIVAVLGLRYLAVTRATA